MLIVEGTDLLGKTELCHGLIECLNKTGPDVPYEYAHSGLPPDDWDYYWSYVKRIKPNIVQDRFHLSEITYGNVARKKTRITDDTLRLVQGNLRLCGAYTVVLTSDDTYIKHMYERRKQEEMFSLDIILAVNHSFQNMLDESYRYDIDYSIDVSKMRAYDIRDMPNQIVDYYLKRQKHLRDTAIEGQPDEAI